MALLLVTAACAAPAKALAASTKAMIEVFMMSSAIGCTAIKWQTTLPMPALPALPALPGGLHRLLPLTY
ncbi:hypothetical protein [Caballeronia grimmiae]|uniref:hypothetical protein n=1 Tax=Caballeronia grimmiae TaxID=1071679 RepID=UPI0038B8E3F4